MHRIIKNECTGIITTFDDNGGKISVKYENDHAGEYPLTEHQLDSYKKAYHDLQEVMASEVNRMFDKPNRTMLQTFKEYEGYSWEELKHL